MAPENNRSADSANQFLDSMKKNEQRAGFNTNAEG